MTGRLIYTIVLCAYGSFLTALHATDRNYLLKLTTDKRIDVVRLTNGGADVKTQHPTVTHLPTATPRRKVTATISRPLRKKTEKAPAIFLFRFLTEIIVSP